MALSPKDVLPTQRRSIAPSGRFSLTEGLELGLEAAQ
jgi:hypothetical protein